MGRLSGKGSVLIEEVCSREAHMGAAGQREAQMASGGHGRLCSKRHIEGPGGTAGCRSQRDAYGIDKERG